MKIASRWGEGMLALRHWSAISYIGVTKVFINFDAMHHIDRRVDSWGGVVKYWNYSADGIVCIVFYNEFGGVVSDPLLR